MIVPSLLSRGVGDSEGFLKLGGDAGGGSAGRRVGLVFENLEFAFVAGVFLEHTEPVEELFLFGGGKGVFDKEVFTHRMGLGFGLGTGVYFLLCFYCV